MAMTQDTIGTTDQKDRKVWRTQALFIYISIPLPWQQSPLTKWLNPHKIIMALVWRWEIWCRAPLLALCLLLPTDSMGEAISFPVPGPRSHEHALAHVPEHLKASSDWTALLTSNESHADCPATLFHYKRRLFFLSYVFMYVYVWDCSYTSAGTAKSRRGC